MKKNYLAFVVFFLLLCSAVVYFHFQNGKYDLLSEQVYVLYHREKDHYINPKEYEDLLPNDFHFGNAAYEVVELQKLDENQRMVYDSIVNDYYSVLRIRQRESAFYMPLSQHASVQFKLEDVKKQISLENLRELDIITLDSFVRIAPELKYIRLGKSVKSGKGEKLKYNLIIPDTTSGKASIILFEPILEEYN